MTRRFVCFLIELVTCPPFKFLLLLFALFLSSEIEAQTTTITGTVRDTSGKVMFGVTVSDLSRSRTSTATDQNGKFVLDVTVNDSLLFSYVGFSEKRTKVTENAQVFDIVMEPVIALAGDEVIVTAFGRKERKEAVVGSVTSVQPTELKIPASNLTTAMAGQIAGMISYQRSGQPGQDNAQFFIRGVTTFGYKQDPLILIDNVELSANDLARLQVDDIASFSILKDASATALYGARGANGVILVSTKEGKEGKAKINFRSEYSASQSTKTLQLVDPIEYMHLYNEATLTRGPAAAVPFTPNKIQGTMDVMNGVTGSNPYVYPAVDWLDLLFKKRATTQRNNLSVNGGGKVAKYYVAGSYNIDNGVLKRDIRNNNDNNVKFENYQLRSNINLNLTRTTEMIVRLSGTFSEYNGPVTTDGSFASDLYNIAMHTSPVLFPAYYEPDAANANTQHILFGNVGIGDAGLSNNSIQYNNPYAALLRGHKNASESRISAQFELNQNFDFITKGLRFRGLFNTNRYSYFTSQNAYSPFYYNIASYDKETDQYALVWLNPQPTGNNVATEYLTYTPGGTNISTFVYLQGALEYNRTFGEHTVSSTVIATRQQTLYSNKQTLQEALPYRNLGLAGRLTYSFLRRYFVEGNFGYNGSERFSANHRYGFFPTIGASWVVSNETFWKGGFADIVTRLKLRASHGLVGNDAIGSQRFFYVSDVGFNQGNYYAQFGTNNQYERKGLVIRNYENLDVTWETSRQTNYAAELTLFKKLNLVAEYYTNYRYNILQQRANVPTTMGLESGISANLGEVRSHGVDLSLDYKQSFAGGAWLQSRANFTYSSNKYIKKEEPSYNEPWRYQVGQPVNRYWGYLAERLFVDDIEAANAPIQSFSTNGRLPQGGDIKYKDLNGDGRIDYLDQTFIGYPTVPEIVYGFGLSGGYKGVDLSAFFQGQARVSFFVDPSRVSPFIQSPDQYIYGNTQVLTEFANDHWSEANQNTYATYPRLGISRNVIENNVQNSTWWLRDGSFLRLKSVEIGYTLPESISKRAWLSNARIYVNGLNLFVWSPFKTWDPEQGGNGFAYPIQKVYNVGININL
ncbi:SusC/RagA family TonB-linked outer membrane protein [Niabella aurantiaca]|uniref:SusC/RagA family TonB-linked outer membrane protein n=1 Tax=Niabella aurantiaca TaxID=379900 RepID=UPI000A02B72C|nr:TonB-dependent receptor [Niabella aurantiaca]